MGVNSLPKTVTRQRRDCDLNPGPSVPESSTLTTRLPSHPRGQKTLQKLGRIQVLGWTPTDLKVVRSAIDTCMINANDSMSNLLGL